MTKISLVVPCYNEQESIPIFYKTVEKILSKLNHAYADHYQWEYWFINDGSNDKSADEIEMLSVQAPEKIHFISFSRNFGKEAAIMAGLSNARGDYVGLMDVDLQDPPELLPQMIHILDQTDYDVVAAQRLDRDGEPWLRSWLSDRFYGFMNRISQVKMQPGVRDYRLMRRNVVRAVLSMPEYNRFSKGIFNWVGFKTKYLKFKHRDRVAGTTHWSLKQLFNYSLEAIMDYSDVPLTMASWLGMLACLLSLVGIVCVIIRDTFFGGSVTGWPSLVVIILFLSGIQLFCLGITGKYIGKIYLETKHRPHYIDREKR